MSRQGLTGKGPKSSADCVKFVLGVSLSLESIEIIDWGRATRFGWFFNVNIHVCVCVRACTTWYSIPRFTATNKRTVNYYNNHSTIIKGAHPLSLSCVVVNVEDLPGGGPPPLPASGQVILLWGQLSTGGRRALRRGCRGDVVCSGAGPRDSRSWCGTRRLDEGGQRAERVSY